MRECSPDLLAGMLVARPKSIVKLPTLHSKEATVDMSRSIGEVLVIEGPVILVRMLDHAKSTSGVKNLV
jgi:hypothetical protein